MKSKVIVFTSLIAVFVTCSTHFVITTFIADAAHVELKDGYFNYLNVKELRIFDGKKGGMIILKIDNGKPMVYFADENKKIRGTLGININGFNLKCFNKGTKMVMELGEHHGGSTLLRMSRNGTNSGATLLVDGERESIKLDGAGTGSSLALFSKSDHSMIGINDKNGRLRCSLQNKESFGSYLGLSDGKGDDCFTAGITAWGENKIVLSKTGTKEVFSAIVHKNGSEMRLANSGVTGGPSFNLQYKDNTPLMRMINGNGDEIWASPSFQNQPPIVVTKKGKRVWEVPKR